MPGPDAIHDEDVSTQDKKEKQPTETNETPEEKETRLNVLSPFRQREVVMEGIIRKTLEGRKDDMEITAEDLASIGKPVEDKPAEDDETAQGGDKEPEKKPKEEPKKETAQGDESLVDIVVDGVTQQVPLSKLVDAGKRTLQKEAAADKRLEEANRILAEAKAKTPEKLPDEGAEGKDSARTTPDATKKPDQKQIKEWVKAIQYGSEEEAEQALSAMLEATGSTVVAVPDIDEDVLIAKIEKRKEEKQRVSIADRFGKDYKDLAVSPLLYTVVYDRVNELLVGGEPNTWETYQKAGDEIRKKAPSILAAISGETVPKHPKKPLDERKERKRDIDNLKLAGGRDQGGSTFSKDEPESEDPKDVLREIRKARGQPI